MFCSKFRFDYFTPYSIKLFDFPYFSETGNILILDSDILFFRKPAEIIRAVMNRHGVFLSDSQDCYSFSKNHLNALFKVRMRSRVNCGLIYFPGKKYYNLDLIESYQKEAHRHRYPTYWVEQTAWALLISKYRKAFKRLGPSYRISRQRLTVGTTGYHFSSRSLRPNFYRKGLRRLKSSGFLEKTFGARPE
ncbi:MAG: hypothetical protein PHN49_04060 [Candidatus Omnitrophica bacterium]|nr:hypothetical protein [Candidatus Omnitrophota bacterium]MDD5670795.1 hypothetical protein [Candidatus Omnitrophota bacterium]